MRLAVTYIFIFFALSLTAQLRPNDFPEELNPNDANFEFYSQKNGVNRKASFDAVKNAILGDASSGVAGPMGPQGPKGDKGDQGDPGVGIAQTLIPGGQVDYEQSIGISGIGGNTIDFSVKDADHEIDNEIQELEIDSAGVWTLSIGGGTGDLSEAMKLENDTLDYYGKRISLKQYYNEVYYVEDTTEIPEVAPLGSCVIVNMDTWKTLQFYQDSSWTEPIVLWKSDFQYMLQSFTTTVEIWATDLGVTVSSDPSAGEITINIPEDCTLHKVNIKLPYAAVDNDNNYYVYLDYAGARTYNTSFSNLNLPSVLVSSAETTSMSRNSPVLFAPDGNAGVDVGVSAFGGGDGSDLEIAIKDFLLASTQFVTLNFSNR